LSGERVERRLAAILAADVVGYSRLMGIDEAGTLARLRTHRREFIDPKIVEHNGRIVKTTGDGILIEFSSVVEAVSCAVAMQRGMVERNISTPDDQKIVFRVGVNLGDIILAEDNDILGDGVNVAARLEGIAEPGGICVSRVVRDQVRDKIDIAFEDLGEAALKNIARPVRVYRVRLLTAEKTSTAATVETTPILALPDKPSIAVLPFQNMSGDPEQEYFADGMVEEIITALSRIRWLFVIARNSSFTYKGQAVDITQVGRELGVRYVLEGSVRKGGSRVRITAQLIEAETGTHLWADRFDGSLEDVFDLQDKIAISVAGVIEPALQAAEIQRSANRPTSDLTAYDLYLQAIPHFASHSRGGMTVALDLVERAIQRDPHYGLALSFAAACRADLHVAGWISDAEANRRTGVDLALKALERAGGDPWVLSRAAYALGCLDEDITTSLALADKSLELNPSFASGWLHSGWLRLFAGHADMAIKHFMTSMRLNPRAPAANAWLGIGIAHFFERRFAEAEVALLRSRQLLPGWVGPYRWLASCYAHLGRLDEASAMVSRLRGVTPDAGFTLRRYRNADQRELFLSGLRLAIGEAS
jgi:adenylate cyclase